jgi:large subunit ribosomal protein L24
MMDGQEVGSKKVRKGDRVVVIAGNARGQKGTVQASFGDRVIIGGVNMHKRHVKRSQAYPQGGRIEIEGSIHISNVRACDEEGHPLKLKMRTNEQGERELVYFKDGQPLVWRSMKRAKS